MTEPPPPAAGHADWARALREKYTEMLRLRRGDRDGSIADPRPAMAALAARWPGALREIDQVPLVELERRERHLGAVVEGEAPAAWAVAMDAYHRHLRGALGAKRWLAGRRPVGGELRAAFVEATASLPHGDDLRAWGDDLPALAAPPGGRLLPLVLARLALATGLAPDALRALLFWPRPRAGDPPP